MFLVFFDGLVADRSLIKFATRRFKYRINAELIFHTRKFNIGHAKSIQACKS